jgi:hypothetical protein
MKFGFLKNLIRFVPVILGLIPSVGKYKDLITAAVTLAEESGLPGPDKKKLARETLIASIETANLIHPGVVNKQHALESFDKVVDNLITGVKNIPRINSIE